MSSRKRILLFIIPFILILNVFAFRTDAIAQRNNLTYLNSLTSILMNSSFLSSMLYCNSFFFLLGGWQDITQPPIIQPPIMLPTDSLFVPQKKEFDYEEFSIIRAMPNKIKFGSPQTQGPKELTTKFNVDSTGSYLRSNELFDSLEISYPLEFTLEDYLQYRQQALRRKIWDSLLTGYDLKKALSGGDIARLLGQATGIAIPLPPNPLMGIFGKPEISINVTGEVNIRVGFRWDSQNLGTVSAFGQTQATPMFNQDIRLNVSGRIGDKVKIGTDWNTHRTFDYQNTFKIGYQGYDDDIIKLVEVGNVQLPLTSSLIGGGQALFGVRADFQFGPLYLKTLFSQRRGERKFVEARGGITKQPFQIRAYDFAKNHFFLDTAYKNIYKEYFATSTPIIPPSASRLRIKEIEVWESTNDLRDILISEVVAFDELEPKKMMMGEKYDPSMKYQQINTGKVARGRMLRLDSSRYRIDYNLGTLTILNLRPDRNYAVGYRVEGLSTAKEDDDYYGTLSQYSNPQDTLILKLLYIPQMQPSYKSLWNRQMKNIYSINASNVNTSDTRIGVWYINQNNDSTDVLQGAPDKLVTILRVDQRNNTTGSPPPDGQFDLMQPFFDPYYGEITFPHPEPFRGGLVEYFTKLGNPDMAQQYIYDEIYDTTYDVARRNTGKDRFIISGEVSGRATNRISLGAFNLAPGSVRVTLDGRQLREYDDYIVDYYAGTLTLRNQQAQLPNANLRVEYEQHDVFNISTRTLAGVRGDYVFLKSRSVDAGLGFTFMHYDQSAIVDRVRIGEEPVSNTMFGIDGRLNWDIPWMTRLLDNLPFYDTKAPSSFSIRGEVAMMLPQPNKRYSEVLSDNGSPVVYIDDFEGAQRYISLGLTPTQWSHSSQPVDSSIAPNDTLRANYRGKMWWFQYFIPRYPINEIYCNRSVAVGRTNQNALEIMFDPDRRGIYNRNPEFLDSQNPNYDSLNAFSKKPENKEKIWGGMMRLLSTFNTNFDTENIEYIEIMMRVKNGTEFGKTKMFIDLGLISEDVIPNNALNTEDGIAENPIPNNIIDVGEDRGIDAMFNDQERTSGYYPSPLNLESDPARDDYSFDFNKEDEFRNEKDFEKYNNFEGNALVAESGQFPDTEILNSNNGQTLSLANDYFSYEVNLDLNPATNPQIAGGCDNGANWKLWRIPIRNPHRRVGNPQFSNIQYIRVWFKGGKFEGQIADWRLVGSQWQRIHNLQANLPPDDSIMQIAFVNREENSGAPDYYTLPPGVNPPKQLNSPDPYQELFLNEQSLKLSVKYLRYGQERMAVRFFRQTDLFFYKQLKFFIHGDGSMPSGMVPGAVPKAYAFLRFGTDSANYYEYRRPLLRGWQDIGIDLEALSGLKETRDSSRIFDRFVQPVQGDPFAQFIIKGNPILTKVQFFGCGISNPAERFPNDLTTTMWVNELRLISPERTADWAAITNMDVKLADLGSVNASASRTQPNFHRLEDRFGDRITTSNWVVTMQGNLEKLAPKEFKQMKLPITYTHSEFFQNPQFVANNDINLQKAADAVKEKFLNDNTIPDDRKQQKADSAYTEVYRRSQTLKVQDSWALTGVQLGIPLDNFLIRETFNRITFGYSYAQEFERSPVVAERFYWIWRLTTQYTLPIPKIAEIQPMKWAENIPLFKTYSGLKLNFLPSNFSTGLNMNRTRTTEQSRFLPFPSPVIRDFAAQRQAQFSWKISEGGFLNPVFDYTVSSISTLVKYELDENGRQRTGSQLAREIFFRNGRLIDFGDVNLHSQTVNLNFTPRIPDLFGINNYLDMSGAWSTNYTWNDPLQPDPAIRDIAKTAGYNGSLRFNTGFRLKALADSWFGVVDQRRSPMRVPTDTSTGFFITIGKIFKTIFLDYDKIDISLTQQTTAMNPGVYGGTGWTNFWARGMIGRSDDKMFGPSFPYQLGLIANPHGGFRMTGSDKFPFFGFETFTGLRPPNATLQDNYFQKTALTIGTNRPLWEGATLDLSWRTDVGYNRTQTAITDAKGVPTFTNIVAQQAYTRTYLAFPSIFGMNLGGSMENIVNDYKAREAAIDATTMSDIEKNQAKLEAMTDAFYNEMEVFRMIGGSAGKFLPAINWGIRWEGIEKWGIWGGIARRISFEHMYQSQYQEIINITDNGKAVQSQGVQAGFQPLFGVTFSFDEEKLSGNLTASLRYNTTTNYMLQSSNRSSIQRQSTEEFSAQASYTLRGWDFPLLGFTFKNDLEFSFLGSVKLNKKAAYNFFDEKSYVGKDNEGRTIDGNTQIIIEPRARYSVSNRLTASFFFRYEGTITEGAASPGFSTTQLGLDIRLSISGGR